MDDIMTVFLIISGFADKYLAGLVSMYKGYTS